jgi:hypothetical protein
MSTPSSKRAGRARTSGLDHRGFDRGSFRLKPEATNAKGMAAAPVT